MKIDRALIMAAGRGMRMMPLTNEKPKAMAPFAGSTLIANGIDAISKYISEIYITVGYKGSMLASHVIEHNVACVFNTEGQDNSWWLYNTLIKYVDAPIYVLTCDNVIELDFKSLEKDYFSAGSPSCMIVPVKPIEGLEGDYIIKEGTVITNLSRDVKSNMYCSGIQIINPFKINSQFKKEKDFNKLWIKMIKKEKLYVSDVMPKKWFTSDNPKQLKILQKKNI